MDGIPTVSLVDALDSEIGPIMLQEVGHSWLVPKLKIAGRETPLDRDLVEQINNERPFSGPPLIARDNIHQ